MKRNMFTLRMWENWSYCSAFTKYNGKNKISENCKTQCREWNKSNSLTDYRQ